MDPERWKEAERLYHAALKRAESKRATFLEKACAGDAELRREVESLLARQDSAEEFLELPALQEAARGLAEESAGSLIGKRFDSYELISMLGAGGMGEVYLAHDQKLDRKVALKFLSEELQLDETARKRFLREARSAAALDHPFICHIHEVGEVDETVFIAMEYVEGETLDRRLERGRLPLKEALEKGVELAEALETAHRHNIVHRDLKPSNIMLTAEGHVKVMDFGLAKRLESAGSAEGPTQTVSASLTQTGMTLGTVAYMSPEQLRGEEVDTRSDIFSFGVVLYEMLTGAHPFMKSQPVETGSAILNEAPAALSQHLEDVSPLLQHTVQKMLAKEPDRRYQVIHDVRTNLEELEENLESQRLVSAPPAGVKHRLPWGLVAVLGLVAIGTGLAFTIWLTRSPELSEPVLKRLTFDPGLTFQPAISPDGRMVAYASDRAGEGNLDIWVQQVGGGEPIRLTRHAADDYEPAFSPDGTKIAFRSEREESGIYVVSTLGGEARLIAPEGRRPRFSPDGQWIAYWSGWPHLSGELCETHVVPGGGGQPRPLPVAGRSPVWSPDGKNLLITGLDVWRVVPMEGGKPVEVEAFEVFRRQGLTGDPAILGAPFVADIWLPEDNSILFSARLGDSTNLWRARIDPGTWKITEPLQRLTRGSGTERQASRAAAGRLVFTNLVENKDIWALPVDANRGTLKGEIRQLTTNAADDSWPSLSADGRTMVFLSRRSGNQDVWLKDLETGKVRPLTETAEEEDNPTITDDGSALAFSVRHQVYIVSARAGVAKRICENCGKARDWSNDGKRLLVSIWLGPNLGYVASLIDAETGEKHELAPGMTNPRLSPDNRWIAFYSFLTSGTRQIFIAPLRNGVMSKGSEWIAVTDGSTNDFEAEWSPDGNLLYFASDRDEFRCLYTQRLHPATKRPIGPPLELAHFHAARRSIVRNPGEIRLSIAPDKVVFTMQELSGSIWMLESANE